MFLFGHLGVGSKIIYPWTRQLPVWAVYLGTLLPDLLDKPLYYAFAALTDRRGLEIGWISCSRTVGHTALFLITLGCLSFALRSKALAALSLGVASHLLLDNLSDSLLLESTQEHSARVALLFPFLEGRFSDMPFQNVDQHWHATLNPITLGFEAVGALILGWDFWKNRHESKILEKLRERRTLRKRMKKGLRTE